MPGLGTIINTAAVILGGVCGILFGRFLQERHQEGLCKACGVTVLFLGIGFLIGAVVTALGAAILIKKKNSKEKTENA